jgi:flagellar biogenesis protein FliO
MGNDHAWKPDASAREFSNVFSRIALLVVVLIPAIATLAAEPTTRPTTTATTTQPAVAQARPAPARDPLSNLPSYGDMLRRTAWTLFAIVAGLVLVAKFLPRWLNASRLMPRAGRGKLIEVIESHRLEPRKAIHLIRVAGQYFLISSSGDRVETLAGGPLDQERIAAALEPERKPAVASAEDAAGRAAARRTFQEVLRGKPAD